ncbi:serine/threonine-protein kinase [Agromyces sp. MMS24-JH15]|uniref:serine/threonine-protein kinase n=1 Tax=Agromyces sp. MMS24-JH15 TaxID=3243765 RepID=UPI003747C370
MTTAPDRPAVDDPPTGTLLDDRYRLDGLVGRGGVASVHRAVDTALGRTVAIKLFETRTGGLHDPARRRRETALLASVSHHSLVTLFDAGSDAATGREYLVMEFVDGPDLGRRLADGPLAPREVADLLHELAEALHVIHARGIVHRDVKPANVLLAPAHVPTREWSPKLADFGIARLVDDAALTATGQVLGTPGYLSPEQVRGRAAGAATDVYALGLVVLEAATGERAFPGPAIEAAGARLVRDPDVPGWLGDGWHDLLAAMTAREPEARPTALDVAMRAAELPAPGSRSAVPVADGASPVDTPTVPFSPTAATRVLPAPPATTPPEPRVSTPRASARGRARRRRGIAVAALVGAAVLVSAGAITASTLLGAGADGGSGTDSSTPPMPSVEGELGVHLEQLEEAVTP